MRRSAQIPPRRLGTLTSVSVIFLNRYKSYGTITNYLTQWSRVSLYKPVIHHAVKKYPAFYRGADKSLARPGMKQARKHIRDARDFNKI